MVWDRPADLTATTAYHVSLSAAGPAGQPAKDMEPYLGMAGHAAFGEDGWDGVCAYASGGLGGDAGDDAGGGGERRAPAPRHGADMADMPGVRHAGSRLTRPWWSFRMVSRAPGSYRIFIQMKHGGTVETGVFDAQVK